MDNTKDSERTDIDRHYIGGQGYLIEFIKDSQRIGAYDLSDSDLIGYLKKAARIEDKDAREMVMLILGKIESMKESGDELRLRFDTTRNAIEKINITLKNNLKKTATETANT